MVDPDTYDICSSQRVSCLLIPSISLRLFPRLQVTNHTIILTRGNDLHPFSTSLRSHRRSLPSPTIVNSYLTLNLLFYGTCSFVLLYLCITATHCLVWQRSLPCFPFCTVFSVSLSQDQLCPAPPPLHLCRTFTHVVSLQLLKHIS